MPGKARTAVRALVFLALAAALFVYLNCAFVMKGNPSSRGNYDAFYSLEPNTVDVMYIGSSATSRFFIPPMAYEDYGIASYVFGVASTPPYYIKDLMQEALRTQKPKLFVIELRPMRKETSFSDESALRKTLDTINLFSPQRIPMSFKATKYCTETTSELPDYLFPIFKYHSRLLQGEMTVNDFLLKASTNKTQGFYCYKKTLTITPQEKPFYTGEKGKLTRGTYEVLDDLLDYCSTVDAEVLFVLAPSASYPEKLYAINTVAEYVKDRGFDLLDFYDNDLCDNVLKIDWSTDYYDENHTNYLGAEKYTAFLEKYLVQHYDLPDRRGDSYYDLWHEGWNYYKDYTSEGIKYHGKKNDTNDDEQ